MQPDGSSIAGSTVMLEGTSFGAMTDVHGEYVISGIEPGIYSITARMVGRTTVTIQEVTVENGNVSRIDFELKEDVVGSTVITVVESRSHVLRDVPSSVFSIDLSRTSTMSSSGIIDMISEQPGVIEQNGDLHVRGGRSDEVDYVLNGVSLRSPMDNRLGFYLPVNSVSNATLITGGMGIKYGNSMSGVVDLVARGGDEELSASVTGRFGDIESRILPSEAQVFTESLDRDLCRTNLKGFEFSVTGTDPVTDILLPELGMHTPEKLTFNLTGQVNFSGDGTDTRGNWSYNWFNDASGILNLSYKISPGSSVSLCLIESYRESGWNQWAWSQFSERNCTEGIATAPGNLDYALPAMFSETQGAVLNLGSLLGDRTHLNLTLGAMRFLSWNRVCDPEGEYIGEGSGSLFWLNQYEPPDLIQDTVGFIRQGIHQNVWFDSKAEVYSADFDLDWNPNTRLRLTGGLGAKYYDLYQYNVYFFSPGLSYISLWKEFPYSGSIYLQSSYRFSGGGIVTLGARGDYFNANTSIYSLETSRGTRVEGKFHASPRVSFSVPFGERSLFFTTYGHYFQIAPMYCYYLHTTFSTGADRAVAGNPDIDPELTTMYEIGIRHELDRSTDLGISFYSKDMTGLMSTEDNSGADYFIFCNDNSRGTANGIETSLSRTQGSNLSGQLYYTYSTARGRYSDALDEYGMSQSGVEVEFLEDNFLEWDQAHQAGASVRYETSSGQGPAITGLHPLENSSVSFSWNYGSGTPYFVPATTGTPVETNFYRLPFTMQTDLFLSRRMETVNGDLTINFSVFNLFNRRNIVKLYDPGLYHESGVPGGSMSNPRAWSPARRFLLTANLSW